MTCPYSVWRADSIWRKGMLEPNPTVGKETTARMSVPVTAKAGGETAEEAGIDE